MNTLVRHLACGLAGLVLVAAVARAGPPDPGVIPDPWFPSQWALHNTGQEYPAGCSGGGCSQGADGADMNGLQALAAGATGEGVIVAIATPGLLATVSCQHSQIASQLFVNPGESGGGKESNYIDDDGNGYVDDVHGFNFWTNHGRSVCSQSSASNHDTDVARLMVAPVDGISGVGVVPDARLMILTGWNDVTFFTKLLDYADVMGVRVVVAPYVAMPLGSGATPEERCTAAGTANSLNRPGMLADSNALVFWGFSDEYPSCDPSAAAVGFTDSQDQVQSTPNTFVDFVAPGERGWSLGVAQSWALPHAAGLVAAAAGTNPGLTKGELLQKLRDGAAKVGTEPYDPSSGRNDTYGYGRIDAWTTLKRLDLDGDGIDGDGDGSGNLMDAPCLPGESVGCDDSCPYRPNSTQSDAGGLEPLGPVPDGIGDACQCGDLNQNGVVNITDISLLYSALSNGLPPSETCDVGGGCTVSDIARLNASLSSTDPSWLKQACPAAQPW